MDRAAVFTVLLIFLIAPATSIEFKVDVAGKSGDALFAANHSTGKDVHTFNASLENPSSVGCNYYFRGEFERGNKTERRYSTSYGLWPGETVDAEINYAPVNYTGTVNADIDLLYCDTVRNVSDYSFEIANPAFNRTYDAKTLEVSENSVKVNFSVRNGTLVPVKTPPYWRVGSSEIDNHVAEIDYEPTLFQNKSMTFAVMQNGTIQGKAEVSLESPEPTLKEKLWDKRFRIALAVLAISVLGNLYLLREKILPEFVLEKIKEIETSRSIKR